MKRIPVGVLGATGMAGMEMVRLLSDHPLFELTFVAASLNNVGKSYREAVSERGSAPYFASALRLFALEDLLGMQKRPKLLFSALSNEAAAEWDVRFASEGFSVVSMASQHRFDPFVPLLIPEVNACHLDLLPLQKRAKGWKGFLVAKPNCTLQSFVIPLEPLHRAFKLKRVLLTTLQAVSGAGFSALSSLDITENVIPYISSEEEKTEKEPLKIWGSVGKEGIVLEKEILLSAHCNRVPVADGHLACVSAEFEKRPTLNQVKEAWETFHPLPQQLKLPSAPNPVIHYFLEKDRPQPKLDRDLSGGMAVSVGRLRPCPLLHIRFVALSHNRVRGAAGGSLLTAELLQKKGFLDHVETQSDPLPLEGRLSFSRD